VWAGYLPREHYQLSNPQLITYQAVLTVSFRWAWTNALRTTKIPKEDRLASLVSTRLAGTKFKKFSKRSKGRKKRTPKSLPERLKQLDLLLRVRSFLRWPVAVRFFAQDVWDIWWEQRHTLGGEPRRSSIAFSLDLRLQEEARDGKIGIVKRKGGQHGQNGVGGVQGLDITYGISTLYHKDPRFTLTLSQIAFNRVSKKSMIYSQNKTRVIH